MIAALLATMLAFFAAPEVATTAADPAPADWRAIPDDQLLVMELAGGRLVVIRLAPGYAPEHVANVRRLALAHWWDGLSVYRVQENWVVQWGDQSEHKPLPADVVKAPAAEYDLPRLWPMGQVLQRSDAYSASSGITADGWQFATGSSPRGGGAGPSWLAHCYGTVGVARDAAPDTGSGAELFAPLGGSARRLDRNYTIVGRVIEGMPYLSSLPRSDAPMGMYATHGERLPIVTVRLASELPMATRPRFEYRAADNPRFAAAIDAKVHPKPPMVGLGGIDVCDVPLATRRVGAK